tara:strand:+ start:669 stop:968 length:300 start_codon:yes stop_codon:yes gene_type:complete
MTAPNQPIMDKVEIEVPIPPVQWTVEVTGRGDSEFTRFYSQDEFWKFMEDIGHRWHDLGLQSYVDYYSLEDKGYVDFYDLSVPEQRLREEQGLHPDQIL